MTPAYVSIRGAAELLGISRSVFHEVRCDPTFPAGRRFGKGGALRFPVVALLAWAEAQPEARFSTRGVRRSPTAA